MNINLEDYNEGVEIAEQLTSVMQSGNEKINDLEQYEKLKEWLENNPYSATIRERLASETSFEHLYSEFNRAECDVEAARLMSTIHKKQRREIRAKVLKISLGTAAAIMAISLVVFNQSKNDLIQNTQPIAEKISTGKIVKARNKPTLVLGNGTNFDLTSSSENIENYIISEKEDKKIIYKKSDAILSTTEYNTLIIPKAYTYNVQLEDGTTVRLNASSELKYPVQFNGNEREVFLKGEAYFEVTKSNKPFVVTVNNVQIKVYGTKFNVNSYSDNCIKTTLISGSVGVSLQDNQDIVETIMKPDQLFIIDHKGNGSLRNVDVTQYTAWMNGYIKGNNDSLAELLTNVAKWYGVEFLYDKKIGNIPVEASLNNKRPLDEILKSIEIIAEIKIIKKTETEYVIVEKN